MIGLNYEWCDVTGCDGKIEKEANTEHQPG